ncbi:MAG: hypothetical protein JRD89_00195 [Deltaproteobacteria bacterium]|nr:hypothetical protein [Deltaproteobacteria bacterium]
MPAWPGSEKSLADYWPYIIPLSRRRKVGRDQWEVVWNPYLTVDGRIRIFVDAHLEADAHYHEEIVEIRREDRFLIVRLRITSDLFGTREDVGTADFSLAEAPPDQRERQVDATNPFENAVTSARGRVIAAFGVGIIPGMGLATAEEVVDADNRYQQRSGDNRKPAPQPSQAPREEPSQPSPRAMRPHELEGRLGFGIQTLNGGKLPEDWKRYIGPATKAFIEETGHPNADISNWSTIDISKFVVWCRQKHEQDPEFLSKLEVGDAGTS